MTRLTFSQKLAAGLGTLALLTVATAIIATWALHNVVVLKDEVIHVGGTRLVGAERLHALSFKKGNDARAYLMTRAQAQLDTYRATRLEWRAALEALRGMLSTEEGRRHLALVDRAEEEHERGVLALFKDTPGMRAEEIGARVERDIRPLRQQLDQAIDEFIAYERELMERDRSAASAAADQAAKLVMGLAVVGILLAVVLSFLLARALARQISTAVRHVESSSAELQAAAGQQATGAKEQATAMSEITTTITELLATSRQISESAKRVAGIAAETAGAARAGDHTVQRSQESVGSIRRQVELIVGHMLELGRKSQQIGGILEIINELAEQTNILAINATIEAAGAGETGRRFAVVAEEIRKLADRVGGSTKDIRTLIEEIRAAVNTTVMATESGSKAVEAGARQFSEVAAAFGQIARLVGTTTDAAREIELSTKQQATAVEQVNVAIANVAQATREAEASSGQALQTASQLAGMSRDLAKLVQAGA